MAPEAALARLAELVAQHGLGQAELEQLEVLLAALADDAHTPTAVREPERAVDVHLADSLAALDLDLVRAASRLVDMGSGAGLPGLALAAALPRARVALLESVARRAALLEIVARRMAVANVQVLAERGESWCGGAGTADVVTARALAPQAVVLEYAAPLLSVGGALVDWRGRRSQEDELAASRAAEMLGLELREIRPTRALPGAGEHHLHVFAKTAATPGRFPRRPGIARKRPLG
jgi:16S rRNA (guanine527-N7)-methyltransferase